MSRSPIRFCRSNSLNGNNSDLQLSFLQVQGLLEDNFDDEDIVSCVEFNSTGNLLATGDKGGRVVIFQTNNLESAKKTPINYGLYCTFQSHIPEFDYLKSLEIEQKINKIRWLDEAKTASNHYLLATNDKTIKLWKLSEKDRRIDDSDFLYSDNDDFSNADLKMPKILPQERTVQTNLRRVFSNAHTFHINSVSVNSDQETFISSDELRINLWNLEVTDESFVIVDIKPPNMEDLMEVISATEFHPEHCHIFAYSTSKGSIKLCDMREAALCDRYSKIFQETTTQDDGNNYFQELISVISDLKFSNSGRYMVTRDYMTVKVWDVNMERQPVETYQVHDYLRKKMCGLYENDYIFDKFECSFSGSDKYIITGSYDLFKIIDRDTRQESLFEINKEALKQKQLRPLKVVAGPENCLKKKYKKDEISVDSIDLNTKIFHSAWNPRKNVIAVALTNNLYLLQASV